MQVGYEDYASQVCAKPEWNNIEKEQILSQKLSLK